jgi:hypothetical protein
MQKSQDKETAKVNPANSKVNRANSKVNRANAQSALWRILFAQANGKLCFEYLKTFSAPENHLPPLLEAGGKTPPKLVFF